MEGWPVNFAAFQTTEKINFKLRLPNIDSELELISEHVTESQGTLFGKINYTLWSGKLYGPKKEGTFFLIKGDNGALGGMFQFNGLAFELLSVNRKNGVIRKPNFNHLSETSCGFKDESNREGEGFTNSTTNNFNSTGICDAPPSSCSNNWKIINAYPQAEIDLILATYNGNLFLASLYLAIVRQTFIATLQFSGIGAPNLIIVDVNIGSYAPSNTDIGIAVDDFNDHAKATLKRRGYDKVVLMTTFSFANNDYGTVNCIPYDATNGYVADCDAAIVNLSTTWFPRLTYAHEVGHLFGARHQSDPEPLCGHGRQFTLGGEDRTVMATLFTQGSSQNANSTSSRILRFSEFLAYYNGFHIGGVDNNNKRLVQNFICENYSLLNQSNPITFRFDNKSNTRDLELYPNPVIDELSLNLAGRQVQKIELYSGKGTKVATYFSVSGEELKLDASNLTAGLYYLKLTNLNKTETLKFIKI